MLYSQDKTVAHADKLRNMCDIYTGLINFFIFFFCAKRFRFILRLSNIAEEQLWTKYKLTVLVVVQVNLQ